MIPIVDVIRPRKTPWITLALIAATFTGLGAEYWLPFDELRTIIHASGLIPETPRASAVLTSLLLHPGLIAALSNGAALWFFGANVEDRFGRLGFLSLFLIAGAAGSLAELWVHETSPFPVLGTAGSVGGVIAAYFALFPTSRILFLLPLPLHRSYDVVEAPAILLVGLWFLAQAIGAEGAITRGMVLGAPPVPAQLAGALVGGLSVFLLRKPLRVNWSEERA
jgi:membrane associated rhomboid family serine protease